MHVIISSSYKHKNAKEQNWTLILKQLQDINLFHIGRIK